MKNKKISTLKEVSLDDKYRLDKTKAYISGIDALVRLPILQHQRDQERGLNTAGFVSGYRGSPLGNVDQAMWRAQKYLDEHHITFTPGINENLAATAVRGSQEVGLQPGSQYDGVFGLWYGKGPGLDQSVDALRHANASGTSKFGGVLAVVGDDHGCKSSTYPYQSEHIFMSLSMPVLAPANVQEVLDLGIFGWELSRYCGSWVGLKAITENMDSAISADIDPNRIEINIPKDFEMPADGVNVRWPDTPLAQEKRLNKYKIYSAMAFARENNLNKIVIDSDKPRLGIITAGKSYLDVLQALDDLGIDQEKAAEIGIRVFKVGMPWPLEPVKTHEFAEGLDEILVVEEKRSVIEDQLCGQLYNWEVDKRPRVIGEYDENGKDLLTNLGELSPAIIARAIAARIGHFYNSDTMEKRVEFINQKERTLEKPRKVSQRVATYCSGCPHNSSTVVPEGSIASGGIGCHYISTFSTARPAHSFTHMGAEGANWVGIAPFTKTKHIFQNLGDGTYFHSGVLAIRQSVAAGVNITYKILYNDAVAMTGGQPIDGNLTLPTLIAQLKGEGIKRIELVSDYPENQRHLKDSVVTISHRDDLNTVQKSLREDSGTTVLIYQQTCATEKRRRRKRGTLAEPNQRIFINDAVCEGCGDCSVKSNCLSVTPKDTEMGRKRQIDQAACNKDFSCVKGFCPSFVSVVGGNLKKKTPELINDFAHLPEPKLPNLDRPWNVLVTGVGGTGVITVTTVLSMAAHLENKGVSTLNQTGLAQKFGPVMSHLRIAKRQSDIYAVRIPSGDADLMIGCDLLVSASDEALKKLHEGRSHAIVNDTISPTAEFMENPDTVFHVDPMKDSIRAEMTASQVDFVAATEIASALLGDTIASNLFMVGYAYQKGLVPVSALAINKALELNGVKVEFNQQAFLWGRRACVDIEGVEKIAKVDEQRFKPLETLEQVLENRRQDLVAYQNTDYAEKFTHQVQSVLRKEQQILGKKSTIFALNYAKTLYRLMAYKDEYEVARLFTDGRFKQQLDNSFEGSYKLEYHMAPPFLSKRDPETGHLRKRKFGAYMQFLFRIIAKCKGLRGSKLDVFGYTDERKLERQLPDELNATAHTLLDQLTMDNIEESIDTLNLINHVRGFGHVKEQNYNEYRLKLAMMLH
ncbi:MAG: indolepyruvate ferredoxin oxidoreductase family protein [Arenicella sp.]